MAISNLGKAHLTTAQKKDIDDALVLINNVLTAIVPNLSDEERRKFGSINEQNKLLVNKLLDYRQNQPALSSPDVDWDEFEADFEDRQFADTRLATLANLHRMLNDFKIVHDYDNYQNSLQDYSYAQYKTGTNTPGFAQKQADIKQFFPNTGSSTTATDTEDTPAN